MFLKVSFECRRKAGCVTNPEKLLTNFIRDTTFDLIKRPFCVLSRAKLSAYLANVCLIQSFTWDFANDVLFYVMSFLSLVGRKSCE